MTRNVFGCRLNSGVLLKKPFVSALILIRPRIAPYGVEQEASAEAVVLWMLRPDRTR
jgi:hypothetical protein